MLCCVSKVMSWRVVWESQEVEQEPYACACRGIQRLLQDLCKKQVLLFVRDLCRHARAQALHAGTSHEAVECLQTHQQPCTVTACSQGSSHARFATSNRLNVSTHCTQARAMPRLPRSSRDWASHAASDLPVTVQWLVTTGDHLVNGMYSFQVCRLHWLPLAPARTATSTGHHLLLVGASYQVCDLQW